MSGSRNRSKKQRADRRRERRGKTLQIIRPEEQKTITGGGNDILEPAAMNTAGNIPGMKRKAGASSSGRGMRKNRYAPDAIANAGSVRTDPGKARSGPGQV